MLESVLDAYFRAGAVRRFFLIIVFFPLYLSLLIGSLSIAKYLTHDFSIVNDSVATLVYPSLFLGGFGMMFSIFIYPLYRIQKSNQLPAHSLTFSMFVTSEGFGRDTLTLKGQVLTWSWLLGMCPLAGLGLNSLPSMPSVYFTVLVIYAVICAVNIILLKLYQKKAPDHES